MRLGVLASHGGTNLQAIIDACRDGRLNAEVSVVVSNNSRAKALRRARDASIPSFHISSQTHPVPEQLDAAICQTLLAHGVDLVVMAGYMKLVGPKTLNQFRSRIINTHPALLPKFGGQGMYGDRVHEAVLAAGEKLTGVSIHLADEAYDRGPIVAQCEIAVRDGDTVETLRARVLAREHAFLVETLGRIVRAEIDLDHLASGTPVARGPAR